MKKKRHKMFWSNGGYLCYGYREGSFIVWGFNMDEIAICRESQKAKKS